MIPGKEPCWGNPGPQNTAHLASTHPSSVSLVEARVWTTADSRIRTLVYRTNPTEAVLDTFLVGWPFDRRKPKCALRPLQHTLFLMINIDKFPLFAIFSYPYSLRLDLPFHCEILPTVQCFMKQINQGAWPYYIRFGQSTCIRNLLVRL